MKFLLSPPLFKLGSIDVTIEILILSIISICLIIAVLGFFRNYRTQMKVSLYLDSETAVYSRHGLELYIKKHNIPNPVLVVAKITNFEFLYKNYDKKVKLMHEISNAFLSGLAKVETLARIDTDEFIILFSNRNKDEIIDFLSEIDKRLDSLEIEDYGSFNFNLLFSYYDRPDFTNRKSIIESIDIALNIIDYSNVREKNVYFYCDNVDDKISVVDQINAQKEAALEEKNFTPYIQPKVDLKTGRVIGGEVLVRWLDSNNNVLYTPDQFIPLFENTGFIRKIDLQMFESACALAQILVNRGRKDIVLSVNLSKVDFNIPNLTNVLLDMVNKYSISSSNIELEITETTVMNVNSAFLSETIMGLRQVGFKVSMDDFGKEASSLGSLATNPFDIIKMDMIFFKNRLSTDKDKCIVKNIINMLKTLNYKVVCEGIEDVQTLDVLATISLDIIIQGYLISKPIPFSQFEAFVDTVFEFDYSPIAEANNVKLENNQVVTTKDGSSTNVYVTNSSNSELDNVKAQMDEMKNMFERQMAERERLAHEREMKQMEAQMEMMRKMQESQANNPSNRDTEIELLKQQIEILKMNNMNQQYPNGYQYPPQGQYPNGYQYPPQGQYPYGYQYPPQPQPEKPTSTQATIDVDELIEKLAKTQATNNAIKEDTSEADKLREALEKEKREKEELEYLLSELEGEEVIDYDDDEVQKIQEEANNQVNLDVESLGNTDDSDEIEDSDESEELEEEIANIPAEKPQYTLAELEAIINDFKNKYESDWNERAKEQLKDGYYEILNGLKYYKDVERKTLVDKVKKANPEVKKLFNIVKNELMQYNDIVNKLNLSYDTFYFKRKQLAKISMTKSRLRVYLAIDPNNYPTSKFPHKDVSSKRVHSRTPYYALIKSQLSVKRIKHLIAEMMEANGISLKDNHKPIDYATKYRFYKKKQK